MTKRARDFGNALVAAVVSIGLLLGALSLSLVDFAPGAAPTATSLALPSPAPVTPTGTFPPTFTSEASTEPTTAALTLTISAGACPPPAGWGQIVVQPGDTLDTIAARYRTGKEQLKAANCLVSEALVPGSVFNVPPVPTSTRVVCVQGAAGWVKTYVVKHGDTLFSIAANHYTTAALLKNVNCRSSDIIYAGELLWVPNVSTRTPLPSPLPGVTVTPHPTDPLTETALPFTATPASTSTPLPFTSTPSLTPTASPTPFP
jgi:LysM repeat protein